MNDIRLTQWRREASSLIDEVLRTAEVIESARDEGGQPIVRTGPEWRLLRTLQRTEGRLSISDLGRALRISKQAAQRLAHEAAGRGRIKLVTNVTDRRLVQVELSASGRAALEYARAAKASWVIVMLNDLDLPEIRSTAHVLRVIQLRLMRDERERIARLTRDRQEQLMRERRKPPEA